MQSTHSFEFSSFLCHTTDSKSKRGKLKLSLGRSSRRRGKENVVNEADASKGGSDRDTELLVVKG